LILVDGVIFQLQRNGGGISRLWTEYLTRLAASDLAAEIVLLDRAGSAPPLRGITRLDAPAVRDATAASRRAEARALGRTCRRANAGRFVSTYYTWAESCTNALTIYDCTPEALGWDLSATEWRCKQEAIAHADAFVALSASTERDFRRLYDPARSREVTVIRPAANERFHPRSREEVEAFRRRHSIRAPYFLACGHRWPHKNSALLPRGLRASDLAPECEILFTGGAEAIEPFVLAHLDGIRHRRVRFDDEELAAAYSGALALVYPSLHEGFGFPVLEAMQCGCPVITSFNAAIPEVAGDAVIYVDTEDVEGMARALRDVRRPETRDRLAAAGLARAGGFSWNRSARELADFLRRLRSAGSN
jgi:glycosyltransferase involved in cell wall biosynthesis